MSENRGLSQDVAQPLQCRALIIEIGCYKLV